jgi:uncharacterized membrane protein YoaK (UPF0700 family)
MSDGGKGMSETSRELTTPAILLILTAVTGVVDAVSFLGMGRIFTANMTGNLLMLAFALSGVPGLSVPRSLSALTAFLSGALIGGRLAHGRTGESGWVARGFLLEAVFLFAASMLSIGLKAGNDTIQLQLYSVIAVTAVAMGLRNALVRKVQVADMTTTVLTMTVTGLAADSALAGGENPRWQRRCGSIAALLVGAAGGALLVSHSFAAPLGICAAATALCALAQFRIDSKWRQK